MKTKVIFTCLNFLSLIISAQIYSDASSNLPDNGAKGQSMDVRTVDIDGDEDLDIILANEFQGNTILTNDGNGNYSDSTATLLPNDNDDTLDGIFVDVDLDYDMDIYVANVMLQTISNQKVYLNDGSGKFTDGTSTILPDTYYLKALGVIAEDFNGDGLKDLYVCDRNTGSNSKDVLFLRDFVDMTNDFENRNAAIQLYPNPVKDQFTIEMPFEIGDSVSFKLIDISGKEIAVLNPENSFENRFTFNISKLDKQLPKGNYFLQIVSKGKNYTIEFVLK